MSVAKPPRNPIRRLLRDRRAAAAVEFAVILPVMLLTYLGTFEASHAIIAKRRIDNAAETVGGIVARSPEMDLTRLRNILLISDAIVGSTGDPKPEITITTVKVDNKGKATQDWSRRGETQNGSPGASYQMPSDLAGITDSYFVFAKVSYAYRPTFDVGGLFGTLHFERTFVFRPRKGSEIPWR